MAIHLGLVSHDRAIATLSHPPIILNDLFDLTQEDRDIVDGVTLTKFKGDLLENLPRCQCNKYRGYPDLGIVCEVCGHEVTDPQGDLEAITWIRKPNGIAALMSPEFFLQLREVFTASRFCVIDWLIDPFYMRRISSYPAWMLRIEMMSLPRGYNNFVNNFDHILSQLAQIKEFQKQMLDDFLEEVKQNRDIIFSSYIPVPNKAILVLEEETTATYVDDIFIGATDAIRKMVGIDTEHSSLTLDEKERRTYGLLLNLARFYDDVYQTFFASKKGMFRKHVYGTRCHWSFRAVISSIDGPCEGDELHIPWGIALCVFEVHIASALMAEGWTPNQVKGFVADHIFTYNEKLHQIMTKLINESPEKGIRCNFNRNPTMSRSSILSMRITVIKTNLRDSTASIPIPVTKLPNADFDGDECNFTLDLDNRMSRNMYGLRPHMNMFDSNKVRKLSNLFALPKPQTTMIGNMFDMEPD